MTEPPGPPGPPEPATPRMADEGSEGPQRSPYADLSDEEILLSFLKDGCDLDGSPLRMATQPEPGPETPLESHPLGRLD